MGKPNKFLYYLRSFCLYLSPRWFLRRRLRQIERDWSRRPDAEQIATRVNYYCRLEAQCPLPQGVTTLGQHHYGHPSVYFFDSFEYTRYFPGHLRWHLRWGDDKDLPPIPSTQKARLLGTDNPNATLLKLDRVRHFFWVRDRVPFEQKRDLLLFRGATVGKPIREAFLRAYHRHPLCDVGDTVGNPNAPQAPSMTIAQQLAYKFILCLEGNDVASNLKWVMSSGSAAVMPPPTCETWFMEGRLQANVHYIAIRPDFADLEERIAYYIAHPTETQAIIRNANLWTAQFRNRKHERIVALLTLSKYLRLVND